MLRYSRNLRTHQSRNAGAFTMIELLVVLTIIVVLASATFFASTTLINRGKTQKTEFALKIVNDALEAFRREEPSIISAGKGLYLKRYGKYPPDELEPFTCSGIPGCTSSTSCRSLIPGGASVVPAPVTEYPPLFNVPPAGGGMELIKYDPTFEHRDIAAMVLGIQLFGDRSSAILSGVPEDHWVDGPADIDGVPLQYLDRDDDEAWDPTKGDEQLRYVVDAWGVPFGYVNQRDFDPSSSSPTQSTNHPDWNEGATEMIALNKGKPIVMSYGPDGREQLKVDMLSTSSEVTLMGDFEENHRVDHVLNQDNIYADPELKLKLAAGIAVAKK